jgi:hypothetical protein
MTRGQIAYLADSNSIFSIYIHYASDSDLNKVLPEYFNSDSEAEDLVMNGNDIRFIYSETGEVERYDKGGAVQITDDEPEDLFSELYYYAKGKGAEVVYVWLEDKWVTLDSKMLKDRRYFVGTLLDQIRNNESTMEAYHVGGNKEVITKEDEDDTELKEYINRQWLHRAGIIK